MKTLALSSALLLTATVTTTTAWAEPVTLRFSDEWKTQGTVYLFSPISTVGTSTVAGTSADVEMDLQDALELLDFSLSGRVESWRGDFGLILDANYFGISGENTTTVGTGPLGRDLDAEVTVAQSWIGFLAGYRVASGTSATGKAYSFDVQGGVRYNSLTQDVDVSGPVRDVSLGGTKDWWEPVIAARGTWEIDEDWTVAAMVDAGGFGAGGNDLSWSATLGFDWSFSEQTSMVFGYRYYSIDFEDDASDGTFGYDFEQHGPFIGLTYAFN